MRAHLATLPYQLAPKLLIALVKYCVGRVNLVPPSTLDQALSPAELFRGHRVSYKNDLALTFGEYVETYEQPSVTNAMEPRTRGAIAMRPVGNVQGTWTFYSLSTGRFYNRSQWKALPMPQAVVDMLDKEAKSSERPVGSDPVVRLGQSVIETEEIPTPVRVPH